MPADTPPTLLQRVLGRAVGLLFAFVGVAALIGAGVLYADSRAFLARSVTAEGTVIALRENRRHEFAPVFRFTTAEGRAVEALYSSYTKPPKWAVGERAVLRYDPARPERPSPETFGANWGASLVVLLLGLVFTGIGGRTVLASRRR